MKSKHIEALISYRMERSRESIRAAEIMLENEMLTISMNRVYYSMFYAVQALLVLHNCFRFHQRLSKKSKNGDFSNFACNEINKLQAPNSEI